MVKALLLTAKYETGFQIFVLAKNHWQLNTNQVLTSRQGQ